MRADPAQRDVNGLAVLTREECLALLGTTTIGRIGITERAMPVILPINYALLDGDVVVCTGTGTKLRAAIDRSVVAFEVDQVDVASRHGWSVCVTGMASEITEPTLLDRARALGIDPLVPVERHRYLRISADMVSGRRLS